MATGLVDDLGDLASLDARGAHMETGGRALHERPHALDVRVPAATRLPLGVRHRVAPRRALATHLTHCCHRGCLPYVGPGSVLRSGTDEKGYQRPALRPSAPSAPGRVDRADRARPRRPRPT